MENKMMADMAKLEGNKLSLEEAVELMYDDYKNEKELTIFTQLDLEPFYETR